MDGWNQWGEERRSYMPGFLIPFALMPRQNLAEIMTETTQNCGRYFWCWLLC